MTTLPEDKLTDLRRLLKACSALVVPAGAPSHGTGFLVDDNLLLTCAHVVKGPVGADVEVRPFEREPRAGTVLEYLPDKSVDLALVAIESVAEEEPQPAVVLDERLDDGVEYFTSGYPKEKLIGGLGLEEIMLKAHKREFDGVVNLLRFESGGATIMSGLSGAAVLNPNTGAVVAIIQYSDDVESDAGGAAIPIERAINVLPRIRELSDEPPLAARRWRDILGQQAFEELGKPWETRRCVDVYVRGTQKRWRVTVDPDEPGTDGDDITVHQLPEEVSEALFKWAQRRRVRNDDEVQLLGRLLAGAVFPNIVEHRIWRDRLADELIVRLHIDGEELFDVPWEFVTVKNKGEWKHVAAEDGLGLVRVAPHANPESVVTTPGHGDAEVLGIVVQPADWQLKMPRLSYSRQQVDWPKRGELLRRLKGAVERSIGFRFGSVDDPTGNAVQDALTRERDEDVSLEVVHYIGFGDMLDGEPHLAFSNGDGDVSWRKATDLFQWVAGSGARLLVVEFALPRYDIEYEPVPPSTFLSALANRVNAVVFTRFPVHPQQFQTFNPALYRELGQGASVEVAVQKARRELYSNQLLGDAAGFGLFTIVTGPKVETRLPPVPVITPVDGAKQERVSEERRAATRGVAGRETFAREGS